MANSIFINKKQFERYKGCSNVTALKQYKLYLELAEKDSRQELTIYDLAKIDGITLEVVEGRIYN